MTKEKVSMTQEEYIELKRLTNHPSIVKRGVK